LPLPDALDLDGLRLAREIVYAIIHALGERSTTISLSSGDWPRSNRRIAVIDRSSKP
jgi:hypothetical protein